MEIRHSVRNFSTLSGAEAIKVTLAAFVTVYLARVLGAAGFGIYGFALAVLGYLTAVVDGGSMLLGTRDVASSDRSAIPSHVRAILSLRLALAAMSLVALLIFILVIREPAIVKGVLLLMSPLLFTLAFTIDWVFYGVEKVGAVARATIARAVLMLIGVLVFVRRPDQLWIVPIAQAASEAAGLVVLWRAYGREFGDQTRPRPRPPRFDLEGARDRFQQGAPMALAQILRAVNYWFSVVLIGLLLEDEAVGHYVGAQRLMLFLLGFASLYFLTYLPLIAGALRHASAEVAPIVSRSIRLTVSLTIPLALGATLLATPIVALVYGPAYVDATRSFQILIWVLPLVIAGAHFRNVLIAANLQRVDLACVGLSALTNVAATVWLVGRLGPPGAAVAMVASEVILLVLGYAAVARRVARPVIAPHLPAPLAASLVMGTAVWWAEPLGLPATILVGMLVYFTALWLLGGVRPGEILGLFA